MVIPQALQASLRLALLTVGEHGYHFSPVEVCIHIGPTSRQPFLISEL